ncbi:DUF4157 domain-containing protein [Nodularia sp. UHCC 0506]|uniref:eCIS core domain-containing protein n=1 Tax=Nodularia sp. UHCC 0506 TaxID=3110243 RepID=UPI002B1EAEE3|nr:DUF4157 domain-containing protein [Nodularia sp. UHCC 0506]MEA5513589.1 DUF4157 domain-containing protein [Nodularia sp. UHCC 0506]
MNRQQVTRNQTPSKSNTPLVSGILQRAAVSPEMDDVESKDDHEAQALINSAFSQDFSKVPISGIKPQQLTGTNQQGHLMSPIQAKWTSRQSDDQYEQAAQLQIADNYSDQQQQPNQKKARPEPGSRENNTGLPDNLKLGIENLSGYSMDDVKVHYNSDQPTKLQAHAFAQGTNIHVAPGQENHLPHEAWHVVQQKQGRVKPTLQLKGKININDDIGLEQEATEMGNRSNQRQSDTKKTARLKSYSGNSTSDPIQLAWYLKCIQNPDNMAGEIQRLQGASPIDTGTFGGNNEYGQPVEINKWLAGGAGISTTHYNPGQNQYYSPVGFVLDILPGDVLGNFEGDGNTSTLHLGKDLYWQAFEAIRGAMIGDVTINADLNANGYGATFMNPVTNLPTANILRTQIENFLANAHVQDQSKNLTKMTIKTTAKQQLQAHYQTADMAAPIGPGGPAGLAALEAHLQNLAPGAAYRHPGQNRDIKYTESQVHGELAHVVGTFYTAEIGDYPDIINATWRNGDPNWLNNRANAANQFRQLLVAAGNPNINLMRLQGGILANAPLPDAPIMPRGFLRWALASVGIAVLYYAAPRLFQLYQDYMEG